MSQGPYTQPDGVEESIGDAVRLTATAAAQAAERIERAREQSARRAERQAVAGERSDRSRIEALRATAMTSPTTPSASTNPQAVHSTRTDGDLNREQADAQERAAREDVTDALTLSDLAAVEDDRADAARAAADRSERDEDRDDDRDGERDAARNNAEDHETASHEAEAEASLAWDSAERRENDAQTMRDSGIDSELVDTRMRADVSQGRPATEATREAATNLPRANKQQRAKTRGRNNPQRGMSMGR